MRTDEKQTGRAAHARTAAAGTIVHADDYGITPEQSRRILSYSSACGGEGALNSLSVMVNSPHFAECADLLEPRLDDIHVGLHLNLVEGHCCADPAAIPLLVDGQGVFCNSFAALLARSERDLSAYCEQVAIEAASQIALFLGRFPSLEQRLRIDSHQHFHLIPAVYEGLAYALEFGDLHPEYVRIPAEPTAPFLQSVDAASRVLPVNWVKHVLLNALWEVDRKRGHIIDAPYGLFCGINFSGHMTAENIGSVMGSFEELAKQQGRALELLFHPGGVSRDEDCLNPSLDGFVAFYKSEFRAAEGEAVRSLHA